MHPFAVQDNPAVFGNKPVNLLFEDAVAQNPADAYIVVASVVVGGVFAVPLVHAAVEKEIKPLVGLSVNVLGKQAAGNCDDAKAILFKTAEKRYGTRKNDYCIGELRQVAVPYTISLISYLTGNKLDLYKIWKNQCLSDALSDFIYDLMKQVNDFIIDKSPITHYIEWAKKDECWEKVKQHEWNFNIEEIKSDLIDENNPPKRKILTDDEGSEEEEKHKENLLRSIPFALWKKIGEWGKDAGFFDLSKQGWASDVAFIVKNNRPFSSRDKSHAMLLFELVCKHLLWCCIQF